MSYSRVTLFKPSIGKLQSTLLRKALEFSSLTRPFAHLNKTFLQCLASLTKFLLRSTFTIAQRSISFWLTHLKLYHISNLHWWYSSYNQRSKCGNWNQKQKYFFGQGFGLSQIVFLGTLCIQHIRLHYLNKIYY